MASIARAFGLIVVAAMSCDLNIGEETPAPAEDDVVEPEVLPPPPAAKPPTAELDALSDVAERTVNSVVNVWSERMVETPRHPFTDPHFFDPHGRLPRERRTRSLGSGVVVAEGVVVTNHHVVAQAASVRVAFSNGDDYEAKIAGSDPLSDLAVLRFDDGAADHPPLPLGESKNLRLGQTLLAVGNPFGVGHSVTMGIVSGVGRADIGIVDYEDFIQTDAAINPGNSGGALVSTSGELVGINTAILSRTGGYQGIGFAIPSSMARTIVSALLADGKVSRGLLGVAVQDLTDELAKAFELNKSEGVLVAEVASNSPAAKAGIEPGDVVLSIAGEEVKTGGHLRNLIAATKPGTEVEVVLLRKDKKRTLKVKLGEVEAKAPDPAPSPVEPQPTGAALGGLEVRELDAVTRTDLGVDEPGGVVIVDVQPRSPADVSDLRPGDVLMQVGDESIANSDDLRRAYDASGPDVVVRIRRLGSSVFVVLHKPKG